MVYEVVQSLRNWSGKKLEKFRDQLKAGDEQENFQKPKKKLGRSFALEQF